MIVDKNTDDYKVDMKKGNSNILVISNSSIRIFIPNWVNVLIQLLIGGSKMQTLKHEREAEAKSEIC